MSLARVQIVLVRTEGPLNLGSVARLCGNFGCGLRLVDVQADWSCRESMMMAHPSHELLEKAPRFATLQEALHDVELAVGTSSKIAEARDKPALDVERARGLLPSDGGTMAFVFGNERTGLLLHEAEQCQRLVKLDTPGPQESLNLSHAVAVVLAILALADRHDVADVRAGAAAKEQLLQEWMASLASAGYFKQSSPSTFAPRMREIFDKMDVSDRDIELLQGMLRVLGKARAP